jgi:hypothetical protein
MTSKKILLQQILGSLLLLFFCIACSDEEDRQETVTKLRALGVEQSPTVAKPGDTVSLTFYLAGPPSLTLTSTPLADDAARYGPPVVVTPIDASPTESAVGPLSLYKYRASFVAPSDEATLSTLQTKGLVRIRYNVKFESNGGDGESIVGDTLIYAPGSPQLEWKPPTINIIKPTENASAGDIDLEGNISSDGNESNRVAWFVSAGKIKNRKSKLTKWEEVPTGSQAIFFTVRGAKSGAFAIRSQAVTLN